MRPRDTVKVAYPGISSHGKTGVITAFDDIPPIGRCACLTIKDLPGSFALPEQYLRIVKRASPWSGLRDFLKEQAA